MVAVEVEREVRRRANEKERQKEKERRAGLLEDVREAMSGRLVLDGDEPYNPPSNSLFEGEDWTEDFIPAPDLEELARYLIERRKELRHLDEVEIVYLWKREGGAVSGQPTLGRCTKPAGMVRHLVGVDFVIWLAADHARDYALTRWQVEAALYHECLHVGIDGKVRPHDFIGFASEITEYGAWDNRLKINQMAWQLRLPLPLEVAIGAGR